jgi:hypothetical protein
MDDDLLRRFDRQTVYGRTYRDVAVCEDRGIALRDVKRQAHVAPFGQVRSEDESVSPPSES